MTGNIVNEPKHLSMTYADLKPDEDESFIVNSVPLYNVVLFSTQDRSGGSIPCVYFVPKSTTLPESIKNKSYVSCSYDKPGFKTGSQIETWLNKNSEHCIQTDVFVSATSWKQTLIERDSILMGTHEDCEPQDSIIRVMEHTTNKPFSDILLKEVQRLGDPRHPHIDQMR
jgi:hypothetical protein